MARPKTDRARRTLRLPPELAARLREEAILSQRSMNAEIVQRLRASFEPRYRTF